MSGFRRLLWLSLALVGAARADDPFQPLPADWKVEPPLEWRSNAFSFVSSKPAFASVPWNVGTQAFTLAWEVDVDRGSAQAWRYPGVCVGLSTAPPDAMDSNTLSVLFALHLDGVAATVRKGRIYEPNRNTSGWPPPLSNMTDQDVTVRYALNQHGAGGRWYSIQWPNTDLDGTRLAFRIERTPSNTLHFAVYHADWEQGDEPWWEKEWPLPPALRTASFSTVVTKTVIGPEDYRSPGRTPEGGVIAGRILGLQGWTGPAAATAPGALARRIPNAPSVVSVEPRESLPAGGEWVTVRGNGFETNTRVFFGARPAAEVKRLDRYALLARVPPGEAGPAPVTAKQGDESFAGSAPFGYAPHPYLYFHAGELPDLRKKFNEPAFAGYKALILQNAAEVPAGGESTEKSGRGGITDLTWAYALTGDAAFRVRLLDVLDRESRSINHEEFRMLAAHDVAVAYDILFAELPLALRLRLERYLERAAVAYVRNVRKRRWWYAQNPSNTIPVGGAGGGGAGLALMHSTPVAREAAELAGPTVAEWYRAIAPDGGCVEGTLYWNFGLTASLRLGHMLRNATGGDAGLLDSPALRNNVHFVETQLGGDGRLFTFNDTQPWLTGLAVCADLGSRFHQPLMLWMADHMAGAHASQTNRPSEVSRGDVAGFAFLWRSREPAPAAFPGVPLAAKLDVMQWGVLRSDASFQPALVAGIKGQGGPVTHHAQADAGSFVVQARGESFLIDPGYYQGAAASHSLPLIDGEGPVLERDFVRDAPLSAPVVSGRFRALGVDSAACYRTPKLHHLRRQFVMAGDRALVVVDDVAAEGTVTSRYQCGFAAAPDPEGRSFTISGRDSDMTVRLFGPAFKLSVEGPLDFGRSWVFRRLADQGAVRWHAVSVDYKAEAGRPLVAVLTAGLKNGNTEACDAVYEGNRIRVRLGRDGEVVFSKQAGGWEPEFKETGTP